MPKRKDAKSRPKDSKSLPPPKEEDKKTALDDSVDMIVTRLISLDGNRVEEKRCLDDHFQREAMELYPDLGRKTYKVPRVHFNKGKLLEEMKGQKKKLDYYEKKPMSDGDARGDRAHAFVLNLLEEMSDNLLTKGIAPLFILNSYHSDSYLQRLCKRSCRVREGDALPGDLDVWKNRGEMDFMVLKPGMVVFIETKSTGGNRNEWKDEDETKMYSAFARKVTDVFKQLDRYEEVFKTNMEESLRAPIRSIHRVAALPNLSLKDVHGIVQAHTGILTQEDVDNPRYKMLCSDSLKSLEIFTQWWLTHIEDIEKSSPVEGAVCNMDAYAECDQIEEVEGLKEMRTMVGRYLCDMSVVEIARGSQMSSPFREVRRPGQAINATGHEFARIALTHTQVGHVNNNEVRLGYLNGPPGSGKTVVLAIRARRWILDQKGVTFILNMYRGSEGRSIGKKTRKTIYKIQDEARKKKLKANCHEIAIDVDNFTDEIRQDHKAAILDVCGQDTARLLFLVDETYVQSYWQAVFNMLMEDFSQSHMWLAGLYGGKPEHFFSMTLKEVMRCPPNVQKVLKEIDWIEERRETYILDSTKADMATDGADVMVLLHKFHPNPGLHPAQCRECGEDLVHFLEDELKVSKSDCNKEDLHPDLQTNSLSCQDVVLLVNLPRNLYTVNESSHLDTNEKSYSNYMKLLESSPLIQTLNNSKYRTKVHTTLPRCELAKGKEEVIHVSWVFSYQGLENKVIIFLPAGPAMLKPDVLGRMTDGERAVWEEATSNIPCPGLIGRYSDQWDSSVGCNGVAKFNPTDTDNSVDQDILKEGWGNSGSFSLGEEEEEEDADEAAGRRYRDTRRKSSVIYNVSDRLRRWKVRDLRRYNRWDKNTLFISASRCTAQLLMIIP